MKIAVIDTGLDDATAGGGASVFLPKLVAGLTEKGVEIQTISEDSVEANGARALANRVNELKPDVYLIWTAGEADWAALPLVNPQTATLAVVHADAEIFYAPVRHYRSFLTRVVGATPETCVGLVINCVIDKERVEWISHDDAEDDAENMRKIIETYVNCFEKAVADALAAPRESTADFPPLKPSRPASHRSWLERLKAKIMN